MPTCPSCHDQYTAGTSRCATCHVPLLPDDVTLPPRVDRLLGVFHVGLVDRVTALLARRGIAHETVPAGEDRVEVVVDRDFRDDLRAELAVNWQGIVASLDPEVRAQVLTAGAPQPGWFDAPTSAWVDRQGRLQVDAGGDEEAMAEAGRLWGPTLVVLGAVIGLFGWYGQDSGALLVAGLLMVGLGLFLPR
jgi:hypothetical protein